MNTPAKVNLYLKVLGKRPDGYHQLETLFWPVKQIYDTVELESDSCISIVCDGQGEGIPCDERNLCWKAVRVFEDAMGRACPVRIHLTKRIPSAGGMGGGSSDGAAVLLELRRLFAPKVSLESLYPLAARLGADVAFFLNPVPSVGRGVGELLQPVPYTGKPCLFIVHPMFPISAAWAYAHFGACSRLPEGALERLLNAVKVGDWQQVPSWVGNDLEWCILEKFPLLQMIGQRMEELGVKGVHVSGSGPVMFGFVDNGTSGEAASVLEREFSGCLKCLCP